VGIKKIPDYFLHKKEIAVQKLLLTVWGYL